MSCTRNPKIGTDGVFQTCLDIKKVTVVRGEKGGGGGTEEEEGCCGERKADLVVTSGDRKKERDKAGYVELLWR